MPWLLCMHRQCRDSQLSMKQTKTVHTHCRHIKHMYETFLFGKITDKMTAMRTWTIFQFDLFYHSAYTGCLTSTAAVDGNILNVDFIIQIH